MSTLRNEIRRYGDLHTRAGTLRMRLELRWSSKEVTCNGWHGSVTYIGSVAALLAAGCLTRSMIAIRRRWRKGQYLRDRAGNRFNLQQCPSRSGDIGRKCLIVQFEPTLSGLQQLLPEGIPTAPPTAVYEPWIFTTTPLPSVARALEHRYPGVHVECALRVHADGSETVCYDFKALNAEVLIRHGLAERNGGGELRAVSVEAETDGSGSINSDKSAYVFHHSVDADPYLPGPHGYPLKKTQREFARIWKRVSAPRRLSPECQS